MDEVKKLLDEAKLLFDKKQFSDVILLLNDSLLSNYNDAQLYYGRARAHFELDEVDKSLDFTEKSIALNNKLASGYSLRGRIWIEKNEFDKAIADIDKSIELEKDNPYFYFYRALASDDKGESDPALVNYTKAIALKNDFAKAYNNRGLIWHSKKEYDKAISDYTKALEFMGDDVIVYNNRGLVWYSKKEYDKAIADYSKALELDPTYAQAYNNRGIIWGEKDEYDLAKADFDKAIELNNSFWKALEDIGPSLIDDPKDSFIYLLQGSAYENLNKNKEALEAYDKCIQIDPTGFNISYRDTLLAKLRVPLKFDSAKADGTLYQIVNAVEDLENEELKLDLIQYYRLELEPLISEIREHSSRIDEKFWIDGTGKPQPKLLAHYTNLKVTDLLVTNDNSYLRYSNAVFMNDPEEGESLIDYLDFLEEKSREKQEIKEAFYNIQKEERTNFYLGSFLPVKDFHEDELLMWRTYGKDENNNEAAGCCLVIDADFFDTIDSKFIAVGKPTEISHLLYKVVYCNKRKGIIEGDEDKLIATKLSKLKAALKALLKKRTKKGIKKNKAIERVLYHSLSELRFFFKSADYSYENELRIIQFATNPDIVKIDTLSPALPRKMYIESTKEVKPHLKKIILGPKVPHPERWIYLEEFMKRKGYKVDLGYSICHFQ